jgi:hypothetical protein
VELSVLDEKCGRMTNLSPQQALGGNHVHAVGQLHSFTISCRATGYDQVKLSQEGTEIVESIWEE